MTRADKGFKPYDKGHYLRKTVWFTVGILSLPLAGVQLVAQVIDDAIQHLNRPLSSLYKWAHPCLYAQPGESTDEYLERIRGDCE